MLESNDQCRKSFRGGHYGWSCPRTVLSVWGRRLLLLAATVVALCTAPTPDGVFVGLMREASAGEGNKNSKSVRSLPLTVTEPAGIQRRDWPVRSGIPFPQNAFYEEDNVRLLDGDGRAFPLQARVMARWPDGSVRWLLLNFEVNLSPRQQKKVRLQYGPGTPDRNEKDMEQVVDIDAFEKKSRSLMEAVPPGGPDKSSARYPLTEKGGLVLFLETDDGRRLTSGGEPPKELLVEENGGLHGIVKMTGRMSGENGPEDIRYTARIHLYRSRPDVVVETVLTNLGDRDVLAQSFGIELHAPDGEKLQYVFGGIPADHTGAVGNKGHVRLHQIDDSYYTCGTPGDSAKRPAIAGMRAPGTLAVEGQNVGVALGVRDFWQQFPMAISIDQGTIRAGFDSPAGARRFRFDTGLAKRVRFVLRAYRPVGNGLKRAKRLVSQLRGYNRPLRAWPGAEWMRNSDVFGALPLADTNRFPCFERIIEFYGAMVLRKHEQKGEYGMRHWGDWRDWHSQRKGMWMNMKDGVPHALFKLYARSGKRKFLDSGDAATRHYMDIDTIHGNASNPHRGATRRQGREHTESGAGPEWTRVSGLWDYHFLTGDVRAREVAMETANYCLRQSKNAGKLRKTERTLGWMLNCVLDSYRATGDEKYLRGAQALAREAYEWQDPDSGVWAHSIWEAKQTKSGVPFMAAVLVRALYRYHKISGDERAREAILRATEWLMEDCRVAPGRFVYKDAPGMRHPRWGQIGWLALASELSDRRRYTREAKVTYKGDITEYRGYARFSGSMYYPGTSNWLAQFLPTTFPFLQRFPKTDQRLYQSNSALKSVLDHNVRMLDEFPWNSEEEYEFAGRAKVAYRRFMHGNVQGAWDLCRSALRRVKSRSSDAGQWSEDVLLIPVQFGFGRLAAEFGRRAMSDRLKTLRKVADRLYEQQQYEHAAPLYVFLAEKAKGEKTRRNLEARSARCRLRAPGGLQGRIREKMTEYRLKIARGKGKHAGRYLLYAASGYNGMGQRKKALRLCREYVRRHPDDAFTPRIRYFSAMLKFVSGQEKPARKALRALVKGDDRRVRRAAARQLRLLFRGNETKVPTDRRLPESFLGMWKAKELEPMRECLLVRSVSKRRKSMTAISGTNCIREENIYPRHGRFWNISIGTVQLHLRDRKGESEGDSPATTLGVRFGNRRELLKSYNLWGLAGLNWKEAGTKKQAGRTLHVYEHITGSAKVNLRLFVNRAEKRIVAAEAFGAPRYGREPHMRWEYDQFVDRDCGVEVPTRFVRIRFGRDPKFGRYRARDTFQFEEIIFDIDFPPETWSFGPAGRKLILGKLLKEHQSHENE